MGLHILLLCARQVEGMAWRAGHTVGDGAPPNTGQTGTNEREVSSIDSLPGAILSTSRILTSVVLSTVLGGRNYHQPHFTDEECEERRG